MCPLDVVRRGASRSRMINLTGLGSTSDKGASKWNSPAHAVQRRIRMQQIEWLIAYGGHTYSQGAGEYFFDWAHFQQMLLDLTAMERQLVD